MFPNKETAIQELELAGKLNPGKWVEHSFNVAGAAELIAKALGHLNSDKTYVCGLLHDIGRRTGIAAVRHIIDGYDYTISKGWDEVSRICLTHSFPVKNIEYDIGKKDDYDKLIILCDALADSDGFCILEKRFIDTTIRYGMYPFSVDRWKKTYEYKDYFDNIIGKSIYTLLPDIEKSIYR